MSRPKQQNEQKTFNYDLSPFMPQNMTRSVSFQHDSIDTLREKLQIKSEALNLLAKQIELCNKEKSEHKRLIDTLYDKNLSLKKSLYFKENEVIEDDPQNSSLSHSATFNSVLNHDHNKRKNVSNFNSSKLLTIPLFNKLSPNASATSLFSDTESEDYMKVLKDLVKTLQKEKFDLKQKYDDCQQQLYDSRSDLRLLREQIVRQRVGTKNEGLTCTITPELTLTDNSMQSMTPDTPLQSSFRKTNLRENLIKEIEALKEEKEKVENDLKLIQCQREEIEIERDSFKEKYNKLNEFLATSSKRRILRNSSTSSQYENENYIKQENASN